MTERRWLLSLVAAIFIAAASPPASRNASLVFAGEDDAGDSGLADPGYPPEMPSPPPEDLAPAEPPPPPDLGEFGTLDAPEPGEEDEPDSDPYGKLPYPYGAPPPSRPRAEPTPFCYPAGAQCTPGDWTPCCSGMCLHSRCL